jgi:hypothetical protein
LGHHGMIVAQLGGGNVLGEGVYIQVFVPERQVLLLPNPVVVRSRSSRLMGIAGDTRHDQMGHDQIYSRKNDGQLPYLGWRDTKEHAVDVGAKEVEPNLV